MASRAEKMKEYQRKYKEKNPEKVKESQKQYKLRNRKKINEYQKKYRIANPRNNRAEESKKRYEKHKEKIKSYIRTYYQKNAERIKEQIKKRTNIYFCELRDCIIRKAMRRSYALRTLQIPPELVEARRLLIQLKRGGYNDCFKKAGRGI